MTARTAYPGTLDSSDFLTDAHFNSLPGGWIGRIKVTATQGSLTTSSAVLTGLTETVTVNDANRLIKVEAFVRFSTTDANDDCVVNIREDGTVVQSLAVTMNRTTNIYGVHVFTYRNPSSGSHTYSLTGGRSAGTGTLTLEADADNPAILLISDVGTT